MVAWWVLSLFISPTIMTDFKDGFEEEYIVHFNSGEVLTIYAEEDFDPQDILEGDVSSWVKIIKDGKKSFIKIKVSNISYIEDNK